ncbi:DUF2752 domain-containing protein [Streptomyces tsukubensis]|uniref:DUF2752 domain-containing protein n=1 Tax=Streptomyces tsukubensis TaxID=83656 RepID=UPI00344BBF2E
MDATTPTSAPDLPAGEPGTPAPGAPAPPAGLAPSAPEAPAAGTPIGSAGTRTAARWAAPPGRPAAAGVHAPAPPQALWRRLAAPVGTIAAVGAAFAYVGTVDPNEPGHYPACPLLRYTGIYCPGCGGLRSAHAFVHGDLGTALGANAVAVAGYGVFFVLWALWTVRAARAPSTGPAATRRISVPPVLWWLTGASVLVFSVVRNLPQGSALAP